MNPTTYDTPRPVMIPGVAQTAKFGSGSAQAMLHPVEMTERKIEELRRLVGWTVEEVEKTAKILGSL